MTPEEKAAWDAHYDPIIQKFKKDKLSGKQLSEWKYQQYMRDYLRVIHSIDRNIGVLLNYLEKTGLLENTMIVYTSDQGFYMGEHGWFDKRFMYEESFRTPLLIRLPGGKKGDIDEFVQNIDYGPTILDLAGIQIPSDSMVFPFCLCYVEKKLRTGVNHSITTFMSTLRSILLNVIMAYAQNVIN